VATNEKILADIQRVEKARGTPDEAYFNKNYGGIDAYIASQKARMTQPSPGQPQQNNNPAQQNYNLSSEMANMQGYLQDMSDAYLKNQQAALESNLTAVISELQAAYQQAVADGQISVRDAEAQFEEQVKQIEQQAYLDAERTALYAQEMGIQNSQQMVGLMQGDMARKQSLMQESMTERDRRINDIKDRMNAIKSQKDISIARAKADYRTGLLGAQSEAQLMRSQNMFDLMRDEYAANREQRFAQENLRLQQDYNLEIIEKEFQKNLELATHNSALAIERMNVQHGLDLETMAQALKDDIAKMAYQYNAQAKLQNAAFSKEMKTLEEKYKLQIKAEEDAYRRQLERDLRGVTPGTDEYKVITANNERELKNKLTEIHVGTVYEAMSKKIIKEFPGDEIEPPKDYTEPDYIEVADTSYPLYDYLGGLKNWLTGYDEKSKEYQKQLEAQQRYYEMLNAANKYFPW